MRYRLSFVARCKRQLHDIHNNFVDVPIDRATGNITLVCKIFYASDNFLSLDQ